MFIVCKLQCPNLDKFLCDRIFPLHNIHDGMANEFVQALYHADAKNFKNYFRVSPFFFNYSTNALSMIKLITV